VSLRGDFRMLCQSGGRPRQLAADGDGATNGADAQARFQVEDIARYRGRVPALDPDLIDLACESYFVDL